MDHAHRRAFGRPPPTSQPAQPHDELLLARRAARITELVDGLLRVRQILRLQRQSRAGSHADRLIRRLLRED